MTMQQEDILKGLKAQKGWYRFCLWFIGPVVKRILRFSYVPCKIQSKTFLALGNHTCDLDPAMLVLGTRRHMRFVANSALGKGVAGFFLHNCFGIIEREKGAKGDAAVVAILQNLKAGVSVGMFPEGNRTWDGMTEFISPRTAALAKESGAALVTYRFTGGYLQRPRWADHKRKGPMRGSLVHEYSPEELAGMSVEEVYDAICRDLRVDACEAQRISGDSYRGKALAEGLERAAYVCPVCHKIGTIRTSGDDVLCDSCGMHTRLTAEGRFTDGNIPFETFAQWNSFQKKWITGAAEDLRKDISEPIASDEGFTVTYKHDGNFSQLSSNATVSIYGDRMEINFPDGEHEKVTCGIDEITGCGVGFKTSIYFNCGQNRRYQLVRHTGRLQGLKYYALWRALSGREYK